jgi:hypothetical protein
MYKIGYNDLKILLQTEKHLLNGHEAWVDQGTLLGLVRDGHFLEWDNDIDITCLHENKPKIRLTNVRKLFESGYMVVTSKYDYTLKKIHGDKSFKKVDLTFIYKKNNRYYKSYSDYKNQNLLAKIFEKTIKELIGLLKKVDNINLKIAIWMLVNPVIYIYRSYFMKTVDMHCPEWQLELAKKPLMPAFRTLFIYEEPEPYLEFKFGSDWRIPKREWDYASEDGALQKNQKDR